MKRVGKPSGKVTLLGTYDVDHDNHIESYLRRLVSEFVGQGSTQIMLSPVDVHRIWKILLSVGVIYSREAKKPRSQEAKKSFAAHHILDNF